MATPERDYRTTHLIRRGVWTYVFALSLIAAFSIAFHFLTDSIVHRQQVTARVVNVSGRQRMLSQRIAKLVIERATHAGFRADAETDGALRISIMQMETSHDDLLTGSKGTGESVLGMARVATVYREQPYELDAKVRAFLRHAQAVADKPETTLSVSDPDVVELEGLARAPLLDALNAAVDAISQTSEESIQHLRHVLVALTALMLVILVLEALFLYRPLFTSLAAANHELILTGRTDALTGLLNRRGFAEAAQEMLTEARQTGTMVSVMMVDIDRFKSINDTYGHAAGDLAINSVALVMLGKTRQTNALARMGGEEFALILRSSTLDAAAVAAERLREAVESYALNMGKDKTGPMLKVTVSIGVAALQPTDTSLFQTLTRADKALYQAKTAGRNRVEIEGDPMAAALQTYPHRSRP